MYKYTILVIIIGLIILASTFNAKPKKCERKHEHKRLDTFPKYIFQTWKSKVTMPDNMAYWHNSWKKWNPGYEMILWDDSDNRTFIQKHYPWFLETYDNYPKTIMRVDAVRYFFLYTYGGIYADLDFECLKSIDPLLNTCLEYDIILGKMDSLNGSEHDIPNAIMISKPKQLFWIYVFNELMENSKLHNKSVEFYTGPIMLKNAYVKYANVNTNVNEFITKYQLDYTNDSNIKIMEPEILYPLSWITEADERKEFLNADYRTLTERVKQKYPKAYTITYWTHTW
jgi:inositol phosphorylceramide mannosyltransferase catalytic subunit